MKIYTRTGDKGTTALFGGRRVSKADIRIDAYGTVDELNSHIGMLRDQQVNSDRMDELVGIQKRLFVIGSILAAVPGNTTVQIPKLNEKNIEGLEVLIDAMDKVLPPMRTFVLPGGHVSVSAGHIARTVCRRAERLVVMLDSTETVEPLVIKYLNRLSDYLFVLCRKMAHELNVEEVPWKGNEE
jgi:cob(I)alamin adenosyltransferase